MIISHRHRFIFVKTAKTAGTSVEVTLARFCGDDDVLTPFPGGSEEGHEPRNFAGYFNPVTEYLSYRRLGVSTSLRDIASEFRRRRRFFHHAPAWLIRKREPDAWDRYYTFCVVRNPFDVAVSGWYYNEWKKAQGLTFDRYLDVVEQRKLARRHGVGSEPYNWWTYAHPQTGEILVDDVLRYEDLTTGLARIASRLTLPWDGHLDVRAKSGLRGSFEPSETQRTRIRQIFDHEFERFYPDET